MNDVTDAFKAQVRELTGKEFESIPIHEGAHAPFGKLVCYSEHWSVFEGSSLEFIRWEIDRPTEEMAAMGLRSRVVLVQAQVVLSTLEVYLKKTYGKEVTIIHHAQGKGRNSEADLVKAMEVRASIIVLNGDREDMDIFYFRL